MFLPLENGAQWSNFCPFDSPGGLTQPPFFASGSLYSDYFKPHYLNLWSIPLVYSLQISPSSLCFVLADPPALASSVIQFLPGVWQIAQILAVRHWLPCVLMKMRLKALN